MLLYVLVCEHVFTYMCIHVICVEVYVCEYMCIGVHRDPPVSPVLGFHVCTICPVFKRWVLRLNLGPHACKVSILLTELSPQTDM